jgi:hypothetical protein
MSINNDTSNNVSILSNRKPPTSGDSITSSFTRATTNNSNGLLNLGADVFAIGRKVNNSEYFNGTISEVMVFNKTLTDEEALTLNTPTNKLRIRLGRTDLDVCQIKITVNGIERESFFKLQSDTDFYENEFIVPNLSSVVFSLSSDAHPGGYRLLAMEYNGVNIMDRLDYPDTLLSQSKNETRRQLLLSGSFLWSSSSIFYTVLE